MYDADGTRHRFKKSADGVTFDPPPGVNLHLRKYSQTDFTRSWAITRPDGVTYFFDRLGYQRRSRTATASRPFDYEPLPNPAGRRARRAIERASDLNCKKRVVRVTRLGGRRGRAGRREPLRRHRSTTRRPFPRATATPPGASRRSSTTAGGSPRSTTTTAPSSSASSRRREPRTSASSSFSYTGNGQDLQPPTTIQDPRQHDRIDYEQQGGPMRRVTQITNRRAKTHRYAYDTRVEQGAHYEIATVTNTRSGATDHTDGRAPPAHRGGRPARDEDAARLGRRQQRRPPHACGRHG